MRVMSYTPTTNEVREAIAEWCWSRRMFRPELAQNDGQEADRWLAAHDAALRAEWEAEQGEGHAEYAVEFDGGITQVSDDRGDVEDWVQWIVGGRLVQREVYTTRWLPVPDTGAESHPASPRERFPSRGRSFIPGSNRAITVPNGEPSDAQVGAAMHKLREIDPDGWTVMSPEGMRAALRAAAGAGQEEK